MPAVLPVFEEIDYNFYRNLIGFHDILLVPVYWIILTRLACYIIKPADEKEKILAKYGLYFKFIGSISSNLIYCLYYQGGDSNAYFNDGKLINKVFFFSPRLGWDIFMNPGGRDNWPADISPLIDKFRYPASPTAWFLCKFTAFFELFCFRSILVTGMFFAFIAFICCWKFYKKISEFYPDSKNYSFIALFMIPSVTLWGSGIYKDTICLACILLLFTYTHDALFKQGKVIKSIIIIFFSVCILNILRTYTLLSFSLCMIFWIYLSVTARIPIKGLRYFLNLCFIIGAIFVGNSVINHTDSTLADMLDLNEVLANSAMTGHYLKSVASTEAFYDLGEIEPTVNGFIRLAPSALNVTFFRPYLWEVKNPLVLLSALESLIFFLLTCYLFIRVSLITIIKTILNDPFIFSSLCFCIIFGVFVGISSFNYGALSRYKIPCLPFYILSVFLVLAKNKKLPFLRRCNNIFDGLSAKK